MGNTYLYYLFLILSAKRNKRHFKDDKIKIYILFQLTHLVLASI